MFMTGKFTDYKFIIPFYFTVSQRLSTPFQIFSYLVHNFIFPFIFLFFLTENIFNSSFAFCWISTHLVYEVGYFMNDYFASDSRISSRSKFPLNLKNATIIFVCKLTLITFFSILFTPLHYFFILSFLFLVYVFHNKLKKKNRMATFVVLRFLKFAPFWFFLTEINLYIFISFIAILSIKEGFISYKKNINIENFINFFFIIFSIYCLYNNYIGVSVLVLIYVFNKKLREYASCIFSYK